MTSRMNTSNQPAIAKLANALSSRITTKLHKPQLRSRSRPQLASVEARHSSAAIIDAATGCAKSQVRLCRCWSCTSLSTRCQIGRLCSGHSSSPCITKYTVSSSDSQNEACAIGRTQA